MNASGGRALDGLGDLPSYQTQPNSEYPKAMCGSHTAGANVRRGEGNNPDLQLRPLIRAKWERMWKSKTTRRLA